MFTGTYDELFACPLPQIRKFVEGAQTSRLGYDTPVIESDEAPSSAITDAPVVELVDVYKTFGAKHVLRGVNLAIYPHRTTVLIGASRLAARA